ncbi:hypothetical protein HPB51_009418 [Rhipicephalus microplus]|uniref:Uncharacterized protein n=1 Tax=Rhipicephalus microplus TaxID=6941 RepID=A0A9J6DZN5_RHIMP|nr:hypothetical protein HPB51_009418 [Rhipicephalus microplus]
MITKSVDSPRRESSAFRKTSRRLDNGLCRGRQPMKAEVKLLQSDKEGGFVLMPKHLYDSKAEEAMRKNFKVLPAIKGTRVRTQAAKLCDEVGLTTLARLTSTLRDFIQDQVTQVFPPAREPPPVTAPPTYAEAVARPRQPAFQPAPMYSPPTYSPPPMPIPPRPQFSAPQPQVGVYSDQ